MKKLNRLFLVVAMMMAFANSKAQEVSPVSFLRMNPYQLNANVATDLPYYCYFSVGLGNFGFNAQYPRLRFRDLFDYNSDGSPSTFDLRKLANGLDDQNSVAFGLNENILTFGYRVGGGMLSVSHNLRVQATTEFGNGLFELLAYGNASILGEDNPTQLNLGVNAQAYHEYALGYQLRVNKNLSVGARAKLLFGIANVKTDAFDMTLYTDPETYAIHFTEHVGVRFSMPQLVQLGDNGLMTDGSFSLADLYRNTGLGFDFAVNYRINDRFSLAAAVNDLGFIKWSRNNVLLVGNINDAGHFYEGESFVFEGLDFDQLQRLISDQDYREMFLDTLKEYFQLDWAETGAYRTLLPASFLLRGSFDINENNRFSAQFQGNFRSDGFRPAMTLAYGGSFYGKIDVCATYTMMKGCFSNIGLGVGFNLGVFHIYGATSNLFKFLNFGGATMRDVQMGIVFNLRERDWTKGSHAPRYLE